MTRTELFALSAFIDNLFDSDNYDDNEEAARLDSIFVAECREVNQNPIEVSHEALAYWRVKAAVAQSDALYSALGRPIINGGCYNPQANA